MREFSVLAATTVVKEVLEWTKPRQANLVTKSKFGHNTMSVRL